MRTVRWAIAALLVVAALSSCSLFQATLTIYNTSSYTVTEVYISPVDEDTWGDDWLDASIPPGGSYEFDGICADTYDLLVIESFGGGWVRGAFEMKSGQNYAWNLSDAAHLLP